MIFSLFMPQVTIISLVVSIFIIRSRQFTQSQPIKKADFAMATLSLIISSTQWISSLVYLTQRDITQTCQTSFSDLALTNVPLKCYLPQTILTIHHLMYHFFRTEAVSNLTLRNFLFQFSSKIELLEPSFSSMNKYSHIMDNFI